VLPSADTAAMLFWALLASGQISMRKVDDALRECFPNDYIRGHTLAGAFVSEPKKPCGFAVE
jgi:hypothetical protein